MKHCPAFLLHLVFGELGIKRAQAWPALEDPCRCTATHIITHKRSVCRRQQSSCDTLWRRTVNTRTQKHARVAGTQRLICLGKQLHSRPTGKGSHSPGGLETISITNSNTLHSPSKSEGNGKEATQLRAEKEC